MKRINLLMALMMVFALSFAACKGDDPAGANKPVNNSAFDVKITELTSSSVSFKVTPKDLEVEYLTCIYAVSKADDFTLDRYLASDVISTIETEARSKGYTLDEYMPQVVDKGVTEGEFTGLYNEYDYYILTFGVASKGDNVWELSTELVRTKITTKAGETLDVTFSIDTVVNGNDAEFTVTPSNEDDVWYFYTLPKRTYDAYTDPEGDFKMNDQQFLLLCLQKDIEARRKAGHSDNKIMNDIFHKGTLTLLAQGLSEHTEYIAQVAGFFVTQEGQISIATGVTKDVYTSESANSKNLTFKLSVTDIEAMRAAIKVTPSNNQDTFIWMVGEYDGHSTAEELQQKIYLENKNFIEAGYFTLYKGVQDYTGGPGSPYKFRLASPDTDYYLIAFGYAGGITTEPVMTTFKTLPAPPAEDTTFAIKASGITPYGFNISVTPSESTTYYTFDIFASSLLPELNEEEFVKMINDDFDASLAAQREQNPDTSVADLLSMYFRRGAFSANATGDPDTQWSAWVAALSAETGHVVKFHVFENVATTSKLGTVKPNVELVGHFSGNEEAGAAFGDAALTENRAITVLKYVDFEGARSLFSSTCEDDITNVNDYTDSQVYGDLKWDKVNKNQPYSFHLVDWDYTYTALTHAVDNDGNIGGISRLVFMPTIEDKADIQILLDLVAELNADSEKSACFNIPTSVVIDQPCCSIYSVKAIDAL